MEPVDVPKKNVYLYPEAQNRLDALTPEEYIEPIAPRTLQMQFACPATDQIKRLYTLLLILGKEVATMKVRERELRDVAANEFINCQPETATRELQKLQTQIGKREEMHFIITMTLGFELHNLMAALVTCAYRPYLCKDWEVCWEEIPAQITQVTFFGPLSGSEEKGPETLH